MACSCILVSFVAFWQTVLFIYIKASFHRKRNNLYFKTIFKEIKKTSRYGKNSVNRRFQLGSVVPMSSFLDDQEARLISSGLVRCVMKLGAFWAS
ncbi:hypothetical protein MUS1_02240 [Marinomonas ushuaiensis DSM 15871]|uniref:Uncharacterized protein n=1 Tax=Marinomonas ushuaiensis DSM 15871 TaxID=1122207 RepID=X7E9R2_9GAMM|nr:hypothetical protein MUS1_02240 [Marinomonas ushuaiensis DSM 15871]